MTSPTFVEEQKELLWKRIDDWQRHAESGMTKEKYLEMREQLGKEASEEKCPPGIEDFPEIVISALNIYNILGDRVYPDVGFIGKDYTNLPILMEIYKIDNIELLIEILSRLETRSIKKSQEHLKREYDKLKRKK